MQLPIVIETPAGAIRAVNLRSLVAVLSLGTGALLLLVPQLRVVAVTLVVSGSLLLCLSLLAHREEGPSIVVDDAGVFDRSLGIGVVPWSAISAASVWRTESVNFVCLRLIDRERFLAALTSRQRLRLKLAKGVGCADCSVNLNLTGISASDVADAINERLRVAATLPAHRPA